MGISTVGGSSSTTQDKTVVYGNPGTYTFTPPAGTSSTNPLLCEVTVIGGGGGGGNYSASGLSGSGGGAAQIIKQSRAYITGPTTVTVGAGGAAATDGGSSVFAGITALGGYAGAASISATSKRTGMDDTTKGAGGRSAINVMYNNSNGSSPTRFKSIGDFGTVSNFTQTFDPPPFNSGNGSMSTALAGSTYVACVPYVTGTSGGNAGGNNTAFYNTTTSTWTIRSTPSLSGAYHCVVAIGNTICCFPGGSTASNTAYYYANAGDTTWTTAYHPISGGNGGTIYYDRTKDGNEIHLGFYDRLTAAYTTNGINWTTYTLPSQLYTQQGCGWIQWLDGQGYYVLNPNGSNANTNNAYTSPNLSTWTTRSQTNASPGNTGCSNGGLMGLGTGGQYLFWRGDNSSSSYPNTWYTSNGWQWNSLGWISDGRSGPSSWSMPLFYTSKNNYIVQGVNAYSGNSYRALVSATGWFPNSESFYSNINESTGCINLVSLPGQSNAIPTSFAGISDFEPTGGSSGVPSSGGNGGDGGGYTPPQIKITAASAAATPGQVPGAGGGGGGAGSTTGAAGAAGLVSIKYYG